MPKTIKTVFTDTAITGVTAPSLVLPVLNYNSDFRLKNSTDKDEVVMINTSSAIDEDEKVRIAVSSINDIFKTSGIVCDLVGETKEGYSLVAQVTRTVTVADSANPSYTNHLPLSAHIVVKVPKHEAITNDVIKALIERAFATLYEEGVFKAVSMLKGAINPKGL